MDIDVYCDESRHDYLNRSVGVKGFTLIGSLWLPKDERKRAQAQIKKLRSEHNAWGEIKWSKVSDSRVDFYLGLVDLFFEIDSMRFRAIVINAAKVNMEKHNDSDAELGFYKFYYQLLVHWIGPNNSYSIFLDEKENRLKDRIKTLQRILGRVSGGLQNIKLQSIQSRQSDLIQLCDFILGAVQSVANESVISSKAKKSVVQRIEEEMGTRIGPTPVSSEKFNIFNIQLRG